MAFQARDRRACLAPDDVEVPAGIKRRAREQQRVHEAAAGLGANPATAGPVVAESLARFSRLAADVGEVAADIDRVARSLDREIAPAPPSQRRVRVPAEIAPVVPATLASPLRVCPPSVRNAPPT